MNVIFIILEEQLAFVVIFSAACYRNVKLNYTDTIGSSKKLPSLWILAVFASSTVLKMVQREWNLSIL